MTDVQALTERVGKLERQSRWFKRAGGAAAVVIVLGLLIGQAGVQKQAAQRRLVEAEGFMLKDKDGKIRGAWTVLPDGGTGLTLHGKDEEARGEWAVLPDGATGLRLYNKDGKSCGAWVVLPDGRTGLTLFGKDEEARIILHVDSRGFPGVSLDDNRHNTRAALTVAEEDNSPVFILTDESGKVIFHAP